MQRRVPIDTCTQRQRLAQPIQLLFWVACAGLRAHCVCRSRGWMHASYKQDGAAMLDDENDDEEPLGLTIATGGKGGQALKVRDAEAVMRAVSAYADHPQVLQVK